MRALEARFHPFERQSESESGGFVVVGRILWDDADQKRPPRIEPSTSLARQTAPATMLATVRHLVLMTSPRSFERLQALHSRYWSFVEIRERPPATEAA